MGTFFLLCVGQRLAEQRADICSIRGFARDRAFFQIGQTKDLIQGVIAGRLGDDQTLPSRFGDAAIVLSGKRIGSVIHLERIGSVIIR